MHPVQISRRYQLSHSGFMFNQSMLYKMTDIFLPSPVMSSYVRGVLSLAERVPLVSEASVQVLVSVSDVFVQRRSQQPVVAR